jgi:post-segregation antitoxin (ccd killing protein)
MATTTRHGKTALQYERTSITLPRGTMKRAEQAGINVSGISRKSILAAIEALTVKDVP